MKSKQNIGRILLMTGVPLALIATILFFVAGKFAGTFGYIGGTFMLLAFIGSIISLVFTVVDTKVPLIANLITNGLVAGFGLLGSILGVIVCTNGGAATIACGVFGFIFGLAVVAFFIVCCVFKVRFVKQVVYKETNKSETETH